MPLNAILCYITALVAMGLAVAAVVRDARSVSHLSFAAGMATLSVESLLIGQGTGSLSVHEVVRLQNWRCVVIALIPGTWLLFSLTYSRGNYLEFLSRWRSVLVTAFALPVGLAIASRDYLFVVARASEAQDELVLALGLPGFGLKLLLLAAAVLVLMNLERTFRAAVGTMRWRIKFVILGLAVLFVVRIYTTSQVLLYRRFDLRLEMVNVGALLIACALIGVSLLRTRVFGTDIYPSHAVLRNSLTVLLTGIYLLIVGVLAKLVTWLGGTAGFPLKAFLVLLALVVLTMLLLSDRVRQFTQRFVSRHLRRPSYDYRLVWQTFTERISPQVTATDLSQAAAKWVSETFNVLSVTIWLANDARKRLIFGASTVVTDPAQREVELSDASFLSLADAMRNQSQPLDLERSTATWAQSLRESNPAQFKEKGGNRFCVPLVAGGEFHGLMTLGDRVSGVRFSVEDVELLKCIGDQVASSLLSIRLSQRLLQAREMEAFQTMSAFLVHDLKNSSNTLSLMLENMAVHFDNPEFRRDAMRGLSRSVEHINDLVQRLGMLRQKLEIEPVESDLNDVVAKSIGELDAAVSARVEKDLQPVPKVMLDPTQMRKVVTNLIINATEAVDEEGRIRVQTSVCDHWAVLSVSDNGCGMSAEFVRNSLFKPFQTTKKRGLGIGMFQSSMIVEAHRGRIEVESEPAKGTTFRVLLPLGGAKQVPPEDSTSN